MNATNHDTFGIASLYNRERKGLLHRMKDWTWIVFIYLLIINVVGYQMMVVDKQRAQRHRRRIPERKLFLSAWLGGALGVLTAMYNKRHKTQHVTFTAGVPFILLVNIFVFGFILLRFG